MNQFHLVRLFVPFFKTGYKQIQPHDKANEFFSKKAQKFQYLSLSTHPEPLIEPTFLLPPLEPCIRAITETTAEEDEEIDMDTESWPFREPKFPLRKNIIQNRIKYVQYQANNPCEDSLVFEQLQHLDAYTISIFDGHGGPELAEYSRCKVNTFINRYLKEHLNQSLDDVGKILKDSLAWSYQQLEDNYFQIYQQQLKIGNKRIRSVGTCGITAIVHNDRVYVGNAGDSQAMFILTEGSNLMRTQKANQRLSVNNKEERERIMEKWKDIDDQIISEEGNNCFYLKGRLQPTRSIGDYYLKKEQYYVGDGTFKGPYLSCNPDIGEFTLTQAHRYMVLASDGLWDVLSRNEVMSSLMNGRQIDLSKTCYEQGEECPYIGNTLDCVLQKCGEMVGIDIQELKQIPKGKRRNYHDDITIAVVDLGAQV